MQKEIYELKLFGVRKTIKRFTVLLCAGAFFYILMQQAIENNFMPSSRNNISEFDIIYPFILAIAMVLWCWGWWRLVKNYNILKQRGIKVDAQIIDVQTYRHSLLMVTSYITYEYKDKRGGYFKTRCSMRPSSYNKMQKYGYIRDNKMEVIYDPQNPKLVYPSVSLV